MQQQKPTCTRNDSGRECFGAIIDPKDFSEESSSFRELHKVSPEIATSHGKLGSVEDGKSPPLYKTSA